MIPIIDFGEVWQFLVDHVEWIVGGLIAFVVIGFVLYFFFEAKVK